MAWLPHPPAVPLRQDDKFWHMLAFITLSVLASLGLSGRALVRIGERLSFLGALIEVGRASPRSTGIATFATGSPTRSPSR